VKYILSYGGGLNSTALLVQIHEQKKPLDLVIFADTGAEKDETLEIAKFYEKWCADRSIKFVTVQSKLGSMYDYMLEKRIIPSLHWRYCTDKWKATPIRKYTKKLWTTDHFLKYIGIDYDEFHRCRKSPTKDETWTYPLVENRITRQGCKDFLKERGLPVPEKSGCWYCPFIDKDGFVKMLIEEPALYKKAMEFEENSMHFPSKTLFRRMPLRKLKGRVDLTTHQVTLGEALEDEDLHMPCDVAGGCFL